MTLVSQEEIESVTLYDHQLFQNEHCLVELI